MSNNIDFYKWFEEITPKLLEKYVPSIGGKGFLVHEYASHTGAKVVFSHYQTAWKGFNKE